MTTILQRISRTAGLSALALAAFIVTDSQSGQLTSGAYAAEISRTEASEWDRWAQHNPESTEAVDHTSMDSILKFITVNLGNRQAMAYATLKGSSLIYVRQYGRYLEDIPVSTLNRDEQLAYWLNLHNVGVIRFLAEDEKAYKKMKKHRGLPGNPGTKWAEKIFHVEGVALSLEDIEQNILFRHWKNPLILYGLCYGTKGNPPIANVGYTGRNVIAQLEASARKFIKSSKNVKLKRANLKVSSIYGWNKDTLFGGDDAQVISHIMAYSSEKQAAQFASARTISTTKYNWRTIAHLPRTVQAGFNSSGSGGGSRGGGGYGGS